MTTPENSETAMNTTKFRMSAPVAFAFCIVAGALSFSCNASTTKVEDGGTAESRNNSPDLKLLTDAVMALVKDESRNEVKSDGPVEIDRRVASPDLSGVKDSVIDSIAKLKVDLNNEISAKLSAAAAQASSGKAEASGGGIADNTDQQAQGVLTFQNAGLSIGGIIVLLIGIHKGRKLSELHQTKRLMIVSKLSRDLVNHEHSGQPGDGIGPKSPD